jgi:branched-chain amino acid transport system ATP-binding protein
MTADTPLLQLDNIRCGYGRGDVIVGLSLEVRRGETVCLIGPNGAGKSTLMKTIIGLIHPTSGRIVFDGRDITATPSHERVEIGIALVPEGRGVLPTLSVEENLLLGGYVRRKEPAVRTDMDRLMTLFPVLEQRKSQIASTLSGGEQQMLVIARALMSRPKLLILDEPSFGLAPLVVASIFRTVTELCSTGTTILLVEQNANMALDVSSRGYVIEAGRCALGGTTAELRESSVVRKVYLGAVA